MRARKRLFLVGCPRSGTTILQRIISAHSAIASWPESNFLPRAIGEWRFRAGLKQRRTVQELYRSWAGHARKGSKAQLTTFLRLAGREELADGFPDGRCSRAVTIARYIATLDKMAGDSPVWLEKTPRHALYLPELTAVPAAKFIHILRPGADAVASIVDISRHDEDFRPSYSVPLADLCRMWNRYVRISVGYCGAPNHHIVLLEDLIGDPETTVRTICEFLGLRYERAMFDGINLAPPKDRLSELFGHEDIKLIRSAVEPGIRTLRQLARSP